MDYRKYGFDEIRLKKRETLINEKVSLYPYSFSGVRKIETIHFDPIQQENAEDEIIISGRVTAIRKMGQTSFFDVKDSTGKIQVYFDKKRHSKTWKSFELIDIGDIIGIIGYIFKTKTGELTINARSWQFLSKAIVSIPFGKESSKGKVYYRSTDAETKYRERYMNWMLDDKDREKIYKRSKIISHIRQKMEELGFLEVSTPTIEFVYGGAEARPFETSIWALGRKKAYLRISPELYLKRYLVGGFDKVFSICQNFRNEGIDSSHNPEFTMIEWYEAYTDYFAQMERFENLVADVCLKICDSTNIVYQGKSIDFSPPWKRLTVLDALKEYANIDVSSMNVNDLRPILETNKIHFHEKLSWGVAVTQLFEKLCEPNLIQPTFIMDHPVEISPLTKIKRGDPRFVERFEPYVNGMEIGNAYSELTDPVDQVQRLELQRVQSDESEYENHPVDTDFIKAIGCGMPPTGGVGLGIDRVVMLLTASPSIRDIIPFPMIKPKLS